VAERNIDERLQLLNGNYHQLRQTTIDAELFDLVAGFEAMTQ
jgi:F-type H+-transporting ATPase subunit gamma